MARTCATTTTLVVHAPMLIMHYVLCTNCCDSPLSESSPVVNLEKYEARRTTTVRHGTAQSLAVLRHFNLFTRVLRRSMSVRQA